MSRAPANWPLQDQTFLFIDRAIGLDPEPIARFVDAHPLIAQILQTGYGFIKWPLLGIPIILTMTLRLVRLQLFVCALVPRACSHDRHFRARSGDRHLLWPASAGRNFGTLNTQFYEAQLRDIVALRDGSLRHLELFHLAGIVSFPSFHVASAVLYMWALWPVRGFASLSVAMNVLMIAATPVIGAHYMIDVIGGVAVAAGSIMLVKRYLAYTLGAGETAQAASSFAQPIPAGLEPR